MGEPGQPPTIGVVHKRRLRELWRSAGWPCQDMVEVELLAAGLLERQRDDAGRETLRVTDAGIHLLAGTLQRNRSVRDEHEALVARVALEMHRAGRVVWRGLSLRSPLAISPPAGLGPAPALPADLSADLEPRLIDGSSPSAQVVAEPPGLPLGLWADTDLARPAPPSPTRWVMAMPDVYSIRHTTVEDYVVPVVHEVKVRRADLLSDLKRPAKAEAYRALGSECWYVLRAGIGEPDEIPAAYGVMVAHPGHEAGGPFGPLEVLRPAPRRPYRLPFATWMVLARATPEVFEDRPQARLGGHTDLHFDLDETHDDPAAG